MIPYDLQLPEFADGVDPSDLGNNQAPLWLCYWYVTIEMGGAFFCLT